MQINLLKTLAWVIHNIAEDLGSLEPLWHPLGFVSCILPTPDDQVTLRIHYWPLNLRRPKQPNWPIHTHIYDLQSLILSGSIRDLQYTTTPGNDYDVYEVIYNGSDSSIVSTGSSLSLNSIVDTHRKTGDIYTINKGVFHQTVVPANALAYTFVALTGKTPSHPLVLGNPNSGGSYNYVREKYGERDKFTLFIDYAREILKKNKIL